MGKAILYWANEKGEVYELVVDELGNPINFTLTPDDKVVLNDSDQKPIKVIPIEEYVEPVDPESEVATDAPVVEPTVTVTEAPAPKKRGRPKKNP